MEGALRWSWDKANCQELMELGDEAPGDGEFSLETFRGTEQGRAGVGMQTPGQAVEGPVN